MFSKDFQSKFQCSTDPFLPWFKTEETKPFSIVISQGRPSHPFEHRNGQNILAFFSPKIGSSCPFERTT